MIGGAAGSFIGPVHRMAAALEGKIELVCGAFSSIPAKSYKMGKELFLDDDRVYISYEEMIEKERKLPSEKRVDFISIVTPNYLHYPIAKTCLEAGFNIVCDKPLVNTIEEADELCRLTKKQNVLFAVTYCFSAYPLVKQARELVRKGVLGNIQKIIVEYSTGWLLKAVEVNKMTQKDIWRMVPAKVGNSLCIGDIGVHAENLAYTIVGLEMEKLNAVTNSYIKGTRLDDEANILVKYQNGVRGIIICSVVAVGETENLVIRVYGNKASLEWHENFPEQLILKEPNGPEKIYKRDADYLEPIAKYNTRFPVGLPEGYVEAFANIYSNFANTLMARESGRDPSEFDLDFPNVFDGARGVYFISCALESAKSNQWVNMEFDPFKY